MLRLGLVGYGDGGRYFHSPFIEAAEGVQLVGIVTRSPSRIAAVKQEWPDIPIYPGLREMIEAGVDAVTISTPPETRRELVLQAIEAGLHVIADKPFAPTAEGARELKLAAERKGVILSVFHNRRCDADIRTLRKVIDSGRLGALWRVHSRMDLDNPQTIEPGPSGGVLRDLGSHLVDQMLWLLGPVTSVFAQTDCVDLPEGSTDVGFTLTLRHKSGVSSHLSASKSNYLVAREFHVYAELGSYVASGTDVQAKAIFNGKRPTDDPVTWGYEREEFWGHLRTERGDEMIPSEQGRYHDYYTAFAQAVKNGTEPPVAADEAIEVLKVLDAAALSAAQGQVVKII
ncbi:dehydrogenase [Hahella sp. CCB-MM4]|uniref:Gfo/Idh/MocA family protein n=1 Tax=Hahella sp. (strain CCB-MM4) TaxID=1926491 RepID=UPI000B9B35AC|nr:Gfo/Idh/MocA family oxidoreductase [Hahella sp. CCB-MM4]OZG70368.1 dehydrogenase [Hahella sp. CCB-MM4]